MEDTGEESSPGLHFQIRGSTGFDGLALRRLLRPESVWRWLPISPGPEMERFIQCWMAFAAHQCSVSAVVDGTVIGMGVLYPLPYRKIRHQSQFALVVAPPWQRQGVGRALLRELELLAPTRFGTAYLHVDVYDGCALLPLLESEGYRCCAEQSNWIRMGEGTVGRRVMYKQIRPFPPRTT